MAYDGIRVWNYIDDVFACVKEDKAQYAFDRLKQIIQELGLPLNPGKVVEPANKMICMGIGVNIKEKTVHIPDEKMEQIVTECVSFQHRSRVARQSLQSLLGILLYLA